MSVVQNQDRARKRLSVLVEHLIEHTQDHADELLEAKAGLTEDAAALRLLDQALADLGIAQRSLGAFRDCVMATG
jgi:hypothetical protein